MESKRRPVLAITTGDAAGIGAEVVVKALAEPGINSQCTPVVIGSIPLLERTAASLGLKLVFREIQTVPPQSTKSKAVPVLDTGLLPKEGVPLGRVSPVAGKASMEWVLQALNLAVQGKVSAIATAPINKEATRLAGYEELGHMELFTRVTGVSSQATMLMTGNLRVVHLTTHRSLRQACDYVTKDRILQKLQLTHASFQKWGFPQPRIAVAALNPHASDGGLLGYEEAQEIEPAVKEARSAGIDAQGPFPADSVFNRAIAGEFDAVLAMYHDQGHIPIKVHGFETSVSVALGLPFIRTSVDHGTAYDIAGKGVADATSMIEAIKVAIQLCRGRLPGAPVPTSPRKKAPA